MMAFKKTNLQFVPVVIIADNSGQKELLVKPVADREKVVAAKIVQVGIGDNFFQVIGRRLRQFGGHDHAAYGGNVLIIKAECGKELSSYPARLFVMCLGASN